MGNNSWVKLGNHVESISKTFNFQGVEKVIFLNTSDIFDGRVINHYWTDVSTLPGQAKKTIQKGDVLFSEIRPANRRFAFIDFDADQYVVSTKLMVLRGKETIFPRYLYLNLTNRRTLAWLQYLAESRSGTFPQITFDQIRDLSIYLPAMEDQKAISAFIGALDDKIELNRKMNQTLEEMARAIFKSWFIDFDPVRYKATGQEPPGLAPHIADLFPDKLRKTDGSELPDGWHSTNLSDIVHVNPPRKLPKGALATYLDMANMPTQGPSPLSWTKRHFSSGMKFINGDTLVARITPCLENGKTAFIDFLDKDETGWGSTEYIVLRPHDPIPPVFAYLLARNNSFRSYAIQQMSGSSGRQRVTAKSISMFKVSVPNKENKIFDVFGKVVNSLFDKISNNMQQIRTLTEIRDTLLPRLISGELRVPDAERIASRYL